MKNILNRSIRAILLAALGAGLIKIISAAPVKPDPALGAMLAAYNEGAAYGGLSIVSPSDKTLFPPDIAAPRFRWKDANGAADSWLVTIEFSGAAGRMNFLATDAEWRPSEDDWELIKRRSAGRTATLTAAGADKAAPGRILSAGSVSFLTSKDAVDAPLFYREVTLPFSEAVKDPSRIRWRMGKVSSRTLPPVILENLPVCGNCHSFSADGSVLGMDVDYASDKGSYAIADVREETVLDKDTNVITWSDYRKEDNVPTFGLLSQVSPDGRYAVSTVKDRSVFVATPGLEFSQLFFPVSGILAVYSRAEKVFRALPGADDPGFVQSNPAWSPDGKYIVFARSRARKLKNLRDGSKVLLDKQECAEFLEGGEKFLFDLYRIPFNGGKGGKAEPLPGASNNGMSNYFPKYSPDGKWIIFCKAESFMLLQPGSELYIMPAAGGKARRLRCNLPTMNSWHSWSPNGRWLVFASKANSPYTQLFLTHIDEQGSDSPAVLLDGFTAPDRAANIPEFVANRGSLLKKIREKFVDALSFLRAGAVSERGGDHGGAVAAYRKALELEPGHPEVLTLLGIALEKSGSREEAVARLKAALGADPDNFEAHANLGVILAKQGDLEGATVQYREAVRTMPGSAQAYYCLAGALGMQSLLPEDKSNYSMALKARADYSPAAPAGHSGQEREAMLDEAITYYLKAAQLAPDVGLLHAELAAAFEAQGKPAAAMKHYREAVKLAPDNAVLHDILAVSLEAQGALDEAITHYREVVRLQPGIAMTYVNLGAALERQGGFDEAKGFYRKALSLEPGLAETNPHLKIALQSDNR